MRCKQMYRNIKKISNEINTYIGSEPSSLLCGVFYSRCGRVLEHNESVGLTNSNRFLCNHEKGTYSDQQVVHGVSRAESYRLLIPPLVRNIHIATKKKP